MNLDNIGVLYDSDVATIRVNDAIAPLKQSLVIAELERIIPYDVGSEQYNNHTINNARSVFVILESFFIDIPEWKDTSNSIYRYWTERQSYPLADKWELFTLLVSDSDWHFVIDAYANTRPVAVLETEQDTTKKNKNSQPSPANTPPASGKLKSVAKTT
jgi:hypothetical protein